MDAAAFKRILTTFADSPADLDLSRGKVIVQVREEMIEAEVILRQGSVHVRESGEEVSAGHWLVQRIARLPLLADRILSYIPGEPHFVTPRGSVLDQLELSPTDEEQATDDAGGKALEILGRFPAGTASVVYLTSDAGEGKTTLISHLARFQAEQFKKKTADWLLVPVPLGGRTFMRFDDVIIGALVNRLRFQFWYYDAFIELLKLGVVVPAFDGFEEMFVEGAAGDAMSALGNLVQSMQSSGAVLIAARKAYFEYKKLQSQTRLFDTLGGQSVSFARVALRRWDKAKFLDYAGSRKVANRIEIYEEVATKLGETHPLLTRAVLVKQLLDITTVHSDLAQLLSNVQSDPNDFFRQFIGTIIRREAREKWLDKLGELAQPLISEEEHYELLSMIAHEMWLSGTETLRAELITHVAELFSDSKHKDKTITRQVVERLKQHALLTQGDGGGFTFDHQEFYHFFLGEVIGSLFTQGDKPGLRHALRQNTLPLLCIEAAAKRIIRDKQPLSYILAVANEVCLGEPRASFVKDNTGAILIRLLDGRSDANSAAKSWSFPSDSLGGRVIENVSFVDCYFQPTNLTNTTLTNCHFEDCEFEEVDLRGSSVQSCVLENVAFHCVTPLNSAVSLFAPEQVQAALSQAGFSLKTPTTTNVAPPLQPTEEEVSIVERLLRAFMRTTAVNENTLQQRLGTQSAGFFRDILPVLLKRGILEEVQFRGAGHQRRFSLGRPLERLTRAVLECGGTFSRFLELAQ